MAVDPTVSKYMSELNKKRKNRRGGWNDPLVQKRALETRKRNKDAKSQEDSSSQG